MPPNAQDTTFEPTTSTPQVPATNVNVQSNIVDPETPSEELADAHHIPDGLTQNINATSSSTTPNFDPAPPPHKAAIPVHTSSLDSPATHGSSTSQPLVPLTKDIASNIALALEESVLDPSVHTEFDRTKQALKSSPITAPSQEPGPIHPLTSGFPETSCSSFTDQDVTVVPGQSTSDTTFGPPANEGLQVDGASTPHIKNPLGAVDGERRAAHTCVAAAANTDTFESSHFHLTSEGTTAVVKNVIDQFHSLRSGITIECSSGDQGSHDFAELCLLGVGGAHDGESIPLVPNLPHARSWAASLSVCLLGVQGVYCIAKDVMGQDVGFIQLQAEDLETGRGQFTKHPRLFRSSDALTVEPLQGALEPQPSPVVRYEVIPFAPESNTSMHEDTSLSLAESGRMALQRFQYTGELVDIANAIGFLQRAVQLTPDGHASLSDLLNDLGGSYMLCFQRTGNLMYLSRAIEVQQRAIEQTPSDDSSLPFRFINLGNLFRSRFEYSGDLSDIAKAIAAQRRAVELTPDNHEDLPALLSTIGYLFWLRFTCNEDLSDLSEAILTQRKVVNMSPDEDVEMPSRLNNLGGLFQSRFSQTGDLSDITEAIVAQQRAVQLTPEGHPNLKSHLTNLANTLQKRFERFGESSDLDQAVSVQNRVIDLTPEGHVDLPASLSGLGALLEFRFERDGKLSDITAAVETHRRAVDLTSDDDSDLPLFLSRLGSSLWSRFQRSEDPSDIAEAIAVQKRAISLTGSGHASMASHLTNLGGMLQLRFKRSGDLADLSEAIEVHRSALRLTPEDHADFPVRLIGLGTSLQSRFVRSGDVSDITAAIEAQEKALELMHDGNADLGSCLNNLGVVLHSRFEHSGNLSDSAKSIAAHRRAIELTPDGHPSLPSRLCNLGNSLQLRFTRAGEFSDIAEAIGAHLKAVELTPDGDASMPPRLNHLGGSYLLRFARTGDLSDVAAAIQAQRKAVELTPDDHADLPYRLTNLGVSFWVRFERGGDLSDIAEAIAAQQKAVQLTPNDHATLPFRLNKLGISFRSRFERSGDIQDLAEAVAVQASAVELTPEDHAELPAYLNGLGTSLMLRFETTRDISDISEAIAVQQRSVKSTHEGAAPLPSRLTNLGSMLQSRFEHAKDVSDIAAAIVAQQRAVELTPPDHPDLPSHVGSLGIAFWLRFENAKDPSDIAEAIAAMQNAVSLTPDGHASLPTRLNNLGNAFHSRFVSSGTMEDLDATLLHYQSSANATSGTPQDKLYGAVRRARLLDAHRSLSPEVLSAFDKTIHLLALIAGLEQTVHGRYSRLQGVSQVALEGVTAACRFERLDKAVEWLEQGRCFVWNQLNNLHTPLDDLREHNGQLAQSFSDVSEQLITAASNCKPLISSMDMPTKISAEDDARRHLGLARRWDELLTCARRIPGFEAFLLPSPCSSILRHLPPSGSIVIINVHKSRCDALALRNGIEAPLHIPLPNFSLEKVTRYRGDLASCLQENHIRMRDGSAGTEASLPERALKQRPKGWRKSEDHIGIATVLRALWIEVGKPILEMLGYLERDSSPHDALPRVWWCSTGAVSFLPIHAAGIYVDGKSESVSDYVVSSYTPTISAVTDRVKSSRLKEGSTTSGLFLTSQPNALKASPVPGTTAEVQDIYSKAGEKGVRALVCQGSDLTVQGLQDYMKEFSSVHLACHASQNAADPLQSRFLLHNGKLNLETIIQMNLKDADLAFLSACQTSTGEEKLSDEAVHLAAGMLAVGYQRVVSTMWSIKDEHAPDVANDFYEYLWRGRAADSGNGFDGSLSAYALHHAVQQLRRRIGCSETALLTWVPYVHFGY
ncbi:hypothetical protein NMY22_g7202 [Coprinellus aureogranulatus]|nr:hypothetical protein NMY22_g7202 [Coprinellus aureogranulatus]